MAMVDTDFGFGYTELNDATFNTLNFVSFPSNNEWPNPNWSTLFLRKLLENTDYKNYFINRFADLLNTTFLSERMNQMILSHQNQLAPEILNHLNRWNLGNYASWQNQVNILHNFANLRPQIQRNQLAQRFNLSNQFSVKLFVDDIQKGYLKINTIELKEGTDGINAQPNPWNGNYFSDVPITITAIPKDGYIFSHWSGGVESNLASIELLLTDDLVLTAHFVEGEETNDEELVYFWTFDNAIPNNTPLVNIQSTYSVNQSQSSNIVFESSLTGYPFNNTHPLWRKASMERRNAPTNINYYPEANDNTNFADANVRGLQIKQPFENQSNKNTLYFNLNTEGWEDVKLTFAVKDEGAVDAFQVEYLVINNQYTNLGLNSSIFNINEYYQLIEIDFSNVQSAVNNPNFVVKIDFIGDDLTSDDGNRVTFNNIAVKAKDINLGSDQFSEDNFVLYPNPFDNFIKINGLQSQNAQFEIFAIDGRLIKKGKFVNNAIDTSDLLPNFYLIKVLTDQSQKISKMVKLN